MSKRFKWLHTNRRRTPLFVGQWQPLVSLGLSLALWIVSTAALNLRERVITTVHQHSIFARLRSQSRSYYGMQLAHVGVAVFIVGVTLVTGYEVEKDIRMSVGDTVNVGGYDFTFNGVTEVVGPNYRAQRAEIEISENNRVRKMYPEKRVYNVSESVMTDTAIDTGVFRDLYLSLGDPSGASGAWSVRVYYKPFVDWIWGGAILMAIGGGLAVTDRRFALRVRERRDAIETEKKADIVAALPTAAVKGS